jgi:undecaprenyl diphosphate synthase
MPGRLHVALIMDGNGRWARERGLPRLAGHREGAKAVRRVVRAAPALGIGTLTLYAFSADNWHRPAAEVDGLMALLEGYLRREGRRCRDHGVRVNVIGRRDRLSARILAAIGAAERATAGGTTLHLRIAVDYSAREALVAATRLVSPDGPTSVDDLARALGRAIHSDPPAPDVDLLVRTSGEQRLSDFLLWEAAYAELVFTPVRWPDFGGPHLEAAVAEFRGRRRRFGRVLEDAG